MALVYVEGNDPWLAEYDACEKLFREIMQLFTMRNKEPKSYASISANIRLRMKQYSGEVRQLQNKLEEASRMRIITAEEAERRMRQVELLQSKDVQLQALFNQRKQDFASSRANLLSTTSLAFADGGTTTWATDDDDDEQPIDIQISVTDLKAQQDRVLQEQEKDLEELCKVIARQKEIGQTISNEVDQQNEIIDDLADHMENTDESLVNRTHQVRNISAKDRTCTYWVIIIILFIAIITIALV